MPAAERAGLVKGAARKMRGHAQEIAELVTLEMGKTVDDALGGSRPV
jgi:acyl-CoA reductase-like NAD-dependent aldehyde dehydrogenase